MATCYFKARIMCGTVPRTPGSHLTVTKNETLDEGSRVQSYLKDVKSRKQKKDQEVKLLTRRGVPSRKSMNTLFWEL